jgi:hypothetical protein
MKFLEYVTILKEYEPFGLRVQGAKALKGIGITYNVEGIFKNCIMTRLYVAAEFYALDIGGYNIKPVLKPLSELHRFEGTNISQGFDDVEALKRAILSQKISAFWWKFLVCNMWDVYDLASQNKIINFYELEKRTT